MTDHNFTQGIYYNYHNYKHSGFTLRKIKHGMLQEFINSLDGNLFNVSSLGYSVEGRKLRLITFGTGRKKILMWSQMHGDESTATMALIDLIIFLSSNDHYNDFRKHVFEEVTLYMFPMVNPDGAEIFERRNSHCIDLNRDAINPQSPEAMVLKELIVKLKADFAFNLHDQNSKYSAGICNKSAAISFLAPPYDYKGSKNRTRLAAMKLISNMVINLNLFIPGHIGKYSEEYEPRAFGDFCQSIGTSTILIESGWWLNDPEKQFVRKLNFILFINAIKSIINNEFKNADNVVYDSLPLNNESLYDVIIRRVGIVKHNITSYVDIALSLIDGDNFLIEDIGDLSTLFGYKEINANEVGNQLDNKVIRPGTEIKLKLFDPFMRSTNLDL